MRIVQISDPHVTVEPMAGGYDGATALAAVLTRVAALSPPPGLVIVTGDLTENGLPGEYARFREVAESFDVPLAAIPGNHDRRDAFATGFAGSRVAFGTGPWLQSVFDAGPLRAVGLDSLGLEGDPAGYLDDDRLRWLDARLAEDSRPAIVFMHHPPFRIGQRIADQTFCADGPALAAVLDRHPQVLALACGHVHRTAHARFADRLACVCPPVAWEIPLDPPADMPVRLVPSAPAFQILDWVAGTHLAILVERLDAAKL